MKGSEAQAQVPRTAGQDVGGVGREHAERLEAHAGAPDGEVVARRVGRQRKVEEVARRHEERRVVRPNVLAAARHQQAVEPGKQRFEIL